jgi:hypothetical protein
VSKKYGSTIIPVINHFNNFFANMSSKIVTNIYPADEPSFNQPVEDSGSLLNFPDIPVLSAQTLDSTSQLHSLKNP